MVTLEVDHQLVMARRDVEPLQGPVEVIHLSRKVAVHVNRCVFGFDGDPEVAFRRVTPLRQCGDRQRRGKQRKQNDGNSQMSSHGSVTPEQGLAPSKGQRLCQKSCRKTAANSLCSARCCHPRATACRGARTCAGGGLVGSASPEWR